MSIWCCCIFVFCINKYFLTYKGSISIVKLISHQSRRDFGQLQFFISTLLPNVAAPLLQDKKSLRSPCSIQFLGNCSIYLNTHWFLCCGHFLFLFCIYQYFLTQIFYLKNKIISPQTRRDFGQLQFFICTLVPDVAAPFLQGNN